MEKLGIEPGSFMKNAGLVGLYKMLQLRGLQDKEFSCDEVDMEKLLELDLTQLYVDTLIEEYGKDTKIHKAFELLDRLITELDSGGRGENFKNDFKFIADTITTVPMQKAYVSVADKVKNAQIYEDFIAKEIKVKEQDEILCKKLKKLKEFSEQPIVREAFYLRSVMKAVINRFWGQKPGKSGMSIYTNANQIRDTKEVFEEGFIKPFREQYTMKKKPCGLCIECGAIIFGAKSNKMEHRPISMLNDIADDLSRKTSVFWNNIVDAYVCPTCAFLYTIIPLGFRKLGKNYTFINSNESIESLIAANMTKMENEESNNYHKYLKKSIAQLITDNKKQLLNIQVITRMGETNKYNFTVIDRETISVFRNETVNDNLNKMLRNPGFKLKSGDWFDVYTECINNIFNYRDQYNLLNYLLNESMRDVWIKIIAYRVFRIQCGQIEVEKGEEMKEIIKAITLKSSKEGYEIRRRLIEEKSGSKASEITTDKQEEIIRGIVYQFTNALKVNNTERFMDMLIRVYSSYKREIPTVFMDMLRDEEKFNLIGYAFVLGLKGAYYTKNEEDEKEDVE